MSGGKDAARDVRHGRRGGGWIPDGEEVGRRAEGPPCVICGRPMLLRQHGVHAACAGWTGRPELDSAGAERRPDLAPLARAFGQAHADGIRQQLDKSEKKGRTT